MLNQDNLPKLEAEIKGKRVIYMMFVHLKIILLKPGFL